MKYFLSTLLLFGLWSFAVAATENNPEISSVDKTVSKTGVSLRPEALQSIKKAKQNLQATSEDGFFSENPVNLLPECGSKRLSKSVLDKIEEYYNKKADKSIIEIRRQKLLQRRLKKFNEIKIKDLVPEDNRKVADKIISYKINDGISEDKMRLCKSAKPDEIYLLIYPKGSDYLIDIIDIKENFPREFTSVYN